MTENNEIVPGTLELLVLRVLAGERLHGYAIARSIAARSGDVLQVEEGSLYPALHRLERRGLIVADWGRSEANRRAKYYRVTPAGRRRLASRTAEWERAAGAIERVLRADPRRA